MKCSAPALAEYPRLPAAYPVPDVRRSGHSVSCNIRISALLAIGPRAIHRVIVSHQIADRVGRRAVRHVIGAICVPSGDAGRRSSSAPLRLGSTDRKYQHENSGPCTFSHNAPVYRRGRFTHPAFTGAHGNMFFTPLMPLIFDAFQRRNVKNDSFQRRSLCARNT